MCQKVLYTPLIFDTASPDPWKAHPVQPSCVMYIVFGHKYENTGQKLIYLIKESYTQQRNNTFVSYWIPDSYSIKSNRIVDIIKYWN